MIRRLRSWDQRLVTASPRWGLEGFEKAVCDLGRFTILDSNNVRGTQEHAGFLGVAWINISDG